MFENVCTASSSFAQALKAFSFCPLCGSNNETFRGSLLSSASSSVKYDCALFCLLQSVALHKCGILAHEPKSVGLQGGRGEIRIVSVHACMHACVHAAIIPLGPWEQNIPQCVNMGSGERRERGQRGGGGGGRSSTEHLGLQCKSQGGRPWHVHLCPMYAGECHCRPAEAFESNIL